MSFILLRRMLLSFGQTPDSSNRELIHFVQNDIVLLSFCLNNVMALSGFFRPLHGRHPG